MTDTLNSGMRTIRTSAWKVALLCAFGLVLTACGDDAPPARTPAPKAQPVAQQAAAQKAAEAAAEVKAPEEEEAPEVFDYRPEILPDPFEPYIELVETDGPKGPLEYYELEEIQILGIISGIRDARAKVKAGNEYFTVRRGTPMGKNHGRVVAIRGDEIVVRERFRDDITHGYKYVETVLKMEK